MTNCIAGAELTHDILPDMLARRSGHIVTIGSIAGIASLPYMAVYAATKGANVLFNLTLQTELQNTGVHATSVNPGFTKGDGLWDRFDLPGHPAFGETTTVDVAKKVVDALRNPGQISLISNPNDVKPVAAMWVTDRLGPRTSTSNWRFRSSWRTLASTRWRWTSTLHPWIRRCRSPILVWPGKSGIRSSPREARRCLYGA